MELLQPVMLWGAAAAVIPILIHLWYSRKGQPLPWAAMRWLSQKEKQPKKGVKLDHVLLLLLRVLMIFLLVLLLSKPFFPILEREEEGAVLHLVEPEPNLVEEFRFELEQALERGEAMHWLDESLSPVQSLEEAAETEIHRVQLPEFLQEQEEGQEIRLYIQPVPDYLEMPLLVSPAEVSLHVSEMTVTEPAPNFISIGEDQFLIVTGEGELEQTSIPPRGGELVFEGGVSYRMDLQDSMEVRHIEASLQAITEVYGLEFREGEEGGSADLWFTDAKTAEIQEGQLVMVTNRIGQPQQPNTFFLPASLKRDESELVNTGRLPELILDKWLQVLGMGHKELQVTKSQLERRFMVAQKQPTRKEANAQTWLMLALLVVILTERVLALKKGL